MRRRCLACRGTYADGDRAGAPYYHACAPITLLRVRRHDGSEIELPAAALADRTIVSSEAEQAALVAAGVLPELIVIEIGRRFAPRAGHRDENAAARDSRAGEPRRIVAEGAGAEELPPAPPERDR